MHPPINILVNSLRNTTFEALKMSYQWYQFQGASNKIITYQNQTPTKYSQSIDINCQLHQLFVS
jgi:hypothetical protein